MRSLVWQAFNLNNYQFKFTKDTCGYSINGKFAISLLRYTLENRYSYSSVSN